MNNKLLFGFILLALSTTTAQAHYVWLERDGNEAARAYFGEWENDVREVTGGSLDRIKAPRVFTADKSASLPIARRADHLEIAVKGAGDVRLIESGLVPRDDKKNGGKTRTIFHAKTGRSDTAAKLDFELVPAAPNSERFTLLFRGAPLAKTEVHVFGPPKWEKALRTDDAGQLRVPTPWKGRYVIEAVHTDETPGENGGDKFDRTRHVFTLTFVNNEGIAW